MRFTTSFALAVLAVGSLCGQSVLSVNSGLVHYAQGTVYIGERLYEPQNSHFTSLKNGQELRTEEGLAEILLSPGSYLRVAENSTIRMISNKLADTQLEVVRGEALLERVDFSKDKAAAEIKGNLVTVVTVGASTTVAKSGIVEFRTDPARVRVYEGEAVIAENGTQLTLKKGKETLLNGALMATKFDAKDGDDLYRWSERRSGVLALANVSSARQVSNSGYGGYGYGFDPLGYGGFGYGGLGLFGLGWGMFPGYGYGFNPYGGFGGGWAYNPWYGMYTFVPVGGYAYSPFGYNFFSPGTVGRVYNSAYNFTPIRNYGSSTIPHNVTNSSSLASVRSAAAISRGLMAGGRSGAVSGASFAGGGGSSGGGGGRGMSAGSSGGGMGGGGGRGGGGGGHR